MDRHMERSDIGEPVLTAVMPVYNGEKHLKEALESIGKIQYKGLEVILIDDSSSDNSGSICREYAKQDRRVRYIRQENQGVAASRNRGLAIARGKYVCFWDQDDIVIGKGLFALLKKMQRESAQMGMCSTRRLIGNKAGDYEKIQEGVFHGGEVQKGLLYPLLFRGYRYDFLKSENYFYGSIWKCIFRKDFISQNRIRFQSFLHYEDDWLFLTKALCRAQKAVTISEAGYCWRVHDASESHKKVYMENLPQRYKSFDKHVLTYLQQEIGDTEIINEFRKVNLCEHYVELYRNAGNARGAAECKECHKSMEQYLRETDYKRQLPGKKQLKTSAYRRQAVLKSLQYGGINVTLFISRICDWLEAWVNHMQWLACWERKRKLK